MAVLPRHQTLETDKIELPEAMCAYHYKAPTLPDKEFIILFQGGRTQQVKTFYLSSFSYIKFKGNEIHIRPDSNTTSIETAASLPPAMVDSTLPPLTALINRTHFVAITKVIYNFDNHHINYKAAKLKTKLEIHNDSLQSECQALAGSIPVTVGRRFIYKSKNRPSFQFLNTLFQQFVAFNAVNFSWQRKITKNNCDIRAHFVSMLLSHYKIDSVKVFQHWDAFDWIDYKGHLGWDWHVAAMVIDDQNQKWVWDPWIKGNKRLLSLQQWLNYPNFPSPESCTITNRSVLYDYEKEELNTPDNFAVPELSFYQDRIQALFVHALPNPPVKPITTVKSLLVQQGFFKQKRLLDDDSEGRKEHKYFKYEREQESEHLDRMEI